MTRQKKEPYQISFERRAGFITSIFNEMPLRKFTIRALAAASGGADKNGKETTAQIVRELVNQGIVENVGEGKYRRAQDTRNAKRGVVVGRNVGSIYVSSPEFREDVFIDISESMNALEGDTVDFIIVGHRRFGQKIGYVTSIVRRSDKCYVGTVEQFTPSMAIIQTSSRALPPKVAVSRRNIDTLERGMKISFRIKAWEEGREMPSGTIVEILGREGDNDTEMHAILVEYDLPYRFPEEVNSAAEAIDGTITREDIASRRDMRDTTTFTIDPADAKDFDDALSIRTTDDGMTEVGVHIADVTHYVRPGSIIDHEAADRGTSVYLVDRTIPMLPERLSNFLCSLRPDEEKLCFSAVFTLDQNARIRHEWFGRTVIRSNHRFSYEEAQQVIESGNGPLSNEILQLNALAQTLRKRRFAEGSIAFERKEAKFNLDEKGHPTGVYFKVQKEANQLIEEFMLLANRRVATFCATTHGHERTMVYRVHDQPDSIKLQKFCSFIRKFGHSIKATSGPKVSTELNSLMNKIKGRPEETAVCDLAVRAMAKAVYTTDNIGHYGLAFDFYTHFTSPIRRYPDMMVHRLLERYLAGKRSANKEEHEALCEHSSEREVVAAEAERASIKYKMVEYISDHVGEEFDGHISGFSNAGMFVELDDGIVEGMVPVFSIHGDAFEFDDYSYELVGVMSGMRYTLGDRVRVAVKNADLQRRIIDFTLISPLAEVMSIHEKRNRKGSRRR